MEKECLTLLSQRRHKLALAYNVKGTKQSRVSRYVRLLLAFALLECWYGRKRHLRPILRGLASIARFSCIFAVFDDKKTYLCVFNLELAKENRDRK